MSKGPEARPRQESDRLPGRASAAWLGGTLLAVIVMAGIAWGTLRLVEEAPGGSSGSVTSPRTGSAGGELPGALDPEAPLRRPFEATPYATRPDSATRARTERYRWIDRERGIVSVPVRRAMEILVAREGGGSP